MALKQMIHFRILIPSLKLRGYASYFDSTRQNRATNHKILEELSVVSRRAARCDLHAQKGKCYNFVTTLPRSDKDLGIKLVFAS